MRHHALFFREEESLDRFLTNPTLPPFIKVEEQYRHRTMSGTVRNGCVWAIHLTSEEAWSPHGPDGWAAVLYGHQPARDLYYTDINWPAWEPEKRYHIYPEWIVTEQERLAPLHHHMSVADTFRVGAYPEPTPEEMYPTDEWNQEPAERKEHPEGMCPVHGTVPVKKQGDTWVCAQCGQPTY